MDTTTQTTEDLWETAQQASEDTAREAARTLGEIMDVQRRRDGMTVQWAVRIGEDLELAWGADDPAAPREGDPVAYVPWEVLDGSAQIRCGAWIGDSAAGDPAALTTELRSVMRRYESSL